MKVLPDTVMAPCHIRPHPQRAPRQEEPSRTPWTRGRCVREASSSVTNVPSDGVQAVHMGGWPVDGKSLYLLPHFALHLKLF